MWNLFQSTTHSRKFVDSLFETSGRYANVEPVRAIEPGDYGHVDKRTGSFQKEGNIYADDFMEKYNLKIGSPTQSAGRDDRVVIVSKNTNQGDLSLRPAVTAPIGAELSVNMSFSFQRGRGAALVLLNSRLLSIPNEAALQPLLAVEEMQGRCVVSKVYRCPSYALLQTESTSASASLQFAISAPGATAAVGPRWIVESNSGTWRYAHSADGAEHFYPLCELKSLKRGVGSVRGSGDGITLPVEEPPWRTLDETGEEEEVEEAGDLDEGEDEEGDEDEDEM